MKFYILFFFCLFITHLTFYLFQSYDFHYSVLVLISFFITVLSIEFFSFFINKIKSGFL